MAANDTGTVGNQNGLILVGLGLGTVEGMTLAAIEAAATADHRRYEAYTALWSEPQLLRLEDKIGPIERVMRPQVEQPDELLALAATSRVALLVVGDPLQATTHVDLQLRAAEVGVPCEVVHGLSITTLVTGAIGLSNYKFGRQTTLTYPYGGWVATSPLEVIVANWSQGLHTLALLDLDPTGLGTGNQQPMQPADAAKAMHMMRDKLEEHLQAEHALDEENSWLNHMIEAQRRYLAEPFESWPVVLCADMGTPDQRVVATTLGALGQEKGGRLNCLVFPARTGEVEESALARWR